ncbi:MAG: hypothetical protein OXU20_01215 [Myxococcales bacterium]|nr:hypothetical protein [Myxococcales bacterium]MDD9971608.1 hypothetical protein [Myxococcales bacterium]
MWQFVEFWIWALVALAIAIYATLAIVARRRGFRLREARLARARLAARRHTKYPIVLAHGWFGFDAVALPGLRQEYFRGVRAALEDHGNEVLVPKVSPVASIKRRAEQLSDQLSRYDVDRVNIVAHSMGGLDARYAITHLGMAPRVASLTTFGTPHRGTPLADRGLLLGDDSWVRKMLSMTGPDMDGLRDLTVRRMEAFNESVPDVPSVTYMSYLGWVEPGAGAVNRLLQPGYRFLNRCAGHNDGLVPASSQRWGDVLGSAQADHWAQIGWSRGLDAPAFYLGLVQTLARSGF